MQIAGKVVVWVCIVCTLLPGCYSSDVVFRTDDFRERIQSGSIQHAVSTNGKKYVFDTTPDIANDVIVGKVDGKSVSIPVTDVMWVRVEKIDWATTTGIGVTVLALTAGIVYTVVIIDMGHAGIDFPGN